MKKNLLLCAAMLGASLLSNAAIINPSKFDRPRCHHDADQNGPEFSEFETLAGSLAYRDGNLTLSIANYWEQCCPNFSLTANTDSPGEIYFNICDEAEDFCDCMCYFNLNATYEGITPGHYTVYFVKTYPNSDYTQTLLSRDIDITEGCDVTLAPYTDVAAIGTAKSMLSLNPEGYVSVNCNGLTTVDIFNADGHLVHRVNLQAPTEVSIATLPAGVYIMRATSGNAREAIRFIR